jgi:hypothetical protein
MVAHKVTRATGRIALGAMAVLGSTVFALAAATPAPTCKFSFSVPPQVQLCSNNLSGSVNREVLVSKLLDACQIVATDIDPLAHPTWGQQVEAIVKQTTACTATGKCSPEVVKSLTERLVTLQGFLRAILNGIPVSIGSNKVTIALKGTNSATEVDPVRAFLEGPNDVKATCVPVTGNATPAPTPTKPSDSSSSSLSGFVIRKNVADLPITHADSQFKGLDKASIAVNDDYVNSKLGINVDLALGYNFEPYVLTADQNSYVTFTPFVYYHQQYVAAKMTSQDQNIYNVAGGLLSTWQLYQIGQFQVAPKFVHAIHADADIESLNLLYTPPITVAGIGGAAEVPLTNGLIFFRFAPRLQVAYSDVTKASTELSALPRGEFGWAGPNLALYLYGAGALEGWSYTASYVYLTRFAGSVSNVQRFEDALNYSLSSDDTWSLQIKYVYGPDLDTLQFQKLLTVGIGLKY